MTKIERRLNKLESLINDWYYMGNEMSNDEYFELTTKIDRIFKYMGEELKNSKIALNYYDRMLSLSYIYGSSEIPLPKEYQIQ